MRKWPCDVCGGPVISVGEMYVLCPRTHEHHLCVDCQRRMFGGIYNEAGRTVTSFARCVNSSSGWYPWTKIARCPQDVTDADRTMWALADHDAPSRSTTPIF